MNKVKVISRSGHEMTLEVWQKYYGLKVGSDKIGEFFSLNEYIFDRDLSDYGELVVNELLMKVMDRFRLKVGKALKVNAFNRNAAKQKELQDRGLRTAKYSPHEVFMAVDIDTISEEQTNEYVKILEGVSKELDIKIRIGYKDYLKNGQTFIHIDVCPEFFSKDKPFHKQKHPVQWESPLRW